MPDIKQSFCELFELPPEVLLDLPIIMMVGQKKLYIENHKGITYYHHDKILIKINTGSLEIKGANLEINGINSINLTITGNLLTLKYLDRGQK